MKQIFWHGLDPEEWKRVQEEGILFGNRETASRCTYLATDIEEAMCHGETVLRVEYDPEEHPELNNWTKDCWQVRVYEPIPIESVSVVDILNWNDVSTLFDERICFHEKDGNRPAVEVFQKVKDETEKKLTKGRIPKDTVTSIVNKMIDTQNSLGHVVAAGDFTKLKKKLEEL